MVDEDGVQGWPDVDGGDGEGVVWLVGGSGRTGAEFAVSLQCEIPGLAREQGDPLATCHGNELAFWDAGFAHQADDFAASHYLGAGAEGYAVGAGEAAGFGSAGYDLGSVEWSVLVKMSVGDKDVVGFRDRVDGEGARDCRGPVNIGVKEDCEAI